MANYPFIPRFILVFRWFIWLVWPLFELSQIKKKKKKKILRCTACGHRMAHRKWKETKLQPGTAGPRNLLGCCLVSFHILWSILCPQAVDLPQVKTQRIRIVIL